MSIFLAFTIIAIAVIAITYKTYVGYGKYPLYFKLIFLLFLVASCFAPVIAFAIKHSNNSVLFVDLIKGLYFAFGFVFFLFIITFIRDTIWMIVDFLRKVPTEQIKNPPHLEKVNICTAIFALLVCIYGVYEANKTPKILEYDIVSPKIKENSRVVMISDLHIDTDVKLEYVTNIVNKINSLNPDVIVLVGDIIDNTPTRLTFHVEELKKLKATYGVYLALGNHEHYVGALDWIIKFAQMGFNVVGNYGQKIEKTGLYIAGIPDINASTSDKIKISVPNAIHDASKDDYVIMLSHTPKIAEGMTKDNIDLVLSGHTHGGQIFPFHYFVKQANDGRLAGFYDVEGIKMYISRGVRYWGPQIRVLAPSEITVFDFKTEKKDAKTN